MGTYSAQRRDGFGATKQQPASIHEEVIEKMESESSLWEDERK